jgi:hypothetical protein
MDYNALVPMLLALISGIAGYFKIKDYHDRILNEKYVELKRYVDKEVLFLKEMSFNEVRQLEKKIDELREDLRKNQQQLIELLTKK